MAKNEIEISLKATNGMSDENSTKQLLLRLDSMLLYVFWEAEEDNVNIYRNRDLPYFFTYSYSSEYVGKIADPLIAYRHNSDPHLLDYENRNINSEEKLYRLMVEQKFSIMEFYLYISNIRNKIRLKELEKMAIPH